MNNIVIIIRAKTTTKLIYKTLNKLIFSKNYIDDEFNDLNLFNNEIIQIFNYIYYQFNLSYA